MTEDARAVPFFPYKLERDGERWRAFNSVDEEPIWLNDHARYLLDLCDGYRTYEEVIRDLSEQYQIGRESGWEKARSVLESATEKGLVWWRGERMQWVPTPPPQSVFWELTWACNLRCLHCVVSAGKKSPEELSLDECMRLADELGSLGVRGVTFSGGEPLLHPQFFEIAERVRGLGMTVQLATNSLLIDEVKAKRLKQLDFDVQITLNSSTPEEHDRFCGVSGAHTKSVAAVALLRNAGVPVTVAAVATKRNIEDIPAIVELALALGVDRFRLIPFIPCGRGKINDELELHPFEMRAVTERLRSERQRGRIKILPMEFEVTLDNPPAQAGDPAAHIGCDGAIGYCTIGAGGEVLPCSFFAGVEAESVKERPFAWVWSNSRFLNYFRSLSIADVHGACRSCSWLSLCGTGCKAANHAKGALFASNVHCWAACRQAEDTGAADEAIESAAAG